MIIAATIVVAVTLEAISKTVALERTDAVGLRVAGIGRFVTRLPLLAAVGERFGRLIRRGRDDDLDYAPLLPIPGFDGVYLIEYEPLEDTEDGLTRSLSYLRKAFPDASLDR